MTTKSIRITALGNGHYRAGVLHRPVAVLHLPGTFTPDQVETLKADTRLIVEEVEIESQAISVEIGSEPQPGEDVRPAKFGHRRRAEKI